MRIKGIMTVLGIAMYAATAFAIPARQEVRTVVQPDGTELRIKVVGDENLHYTLSEEGYILTQDADGFYRLASVDEDGNTVSTGYTPDKAALAKGAMRLSDIDLKKVSEKRQAKRMAPETGMGTYTKDYPVTGSPRCLVFLVEFSDVKFSENFNAKEYFTNMLNQPGFDVYGATGSVSDYFREQSGGKFTPIFDVYGPVTLPETQAYYGGNYGQGWDMKAHYMVSHAAKILDSEVDFSLYDLNKDDDVDFIYVFYAGQGEHNKGGQNTVWPHSGRLKSVADFNILDGKWLNLYACSNELEGDMLAGMGNFVHEYSHVLGLPDLYTTDMTVAVRDFTPGRYTVMDYGVYNNDGRTPPNYTAYELNALGWSEPRTIEETETVELEDISTGEFGIIRTDKKTEFFLVENRQQTGWDTYIPNHGMLVWHIDCGTSAFSSNTVNYNKDHQYVRLVTANNEMSFLNYSEGYPFPGSTNNTSLTSETTPALKNWAGSAIDVPLTNIAEIDGKVWFDVKGGQPLGAPAPAATAEGRSFTASWSPVEGASDYLLTVYAGSSLDGGGQIVEGYNAIPTGGATTYKVDNLPEEGTDFHFTVTAARVDNRTASAPVDVTLAEEEPEPEPVEITIEIKVTGDYERAMILVYDPDVDLDYKYAPITEEPQEAYTYTTTVPQTIYLQVDDRYTATLSCNMEAGDDTYTIGTGSMTPIRLYAGAEGAVFTINVTKEAIPTPAEMRVALGELDYTVRPDMENDPVLTMTEEGVYSGTFEVEKGSDHNSFLFYGVDADGNILYYVSPSIDGGKTYQIVNFANSSSFNYTNIEAFASLGDAGSWTAAYPSGYKGGEITATVNILNPQVSLSFKGTIEIEDAPPTELYVVTGTGWSASFLRSDNDQILALQADGTYKGKVSLPSGMYFKFYGVYNEDGTWYSATRAFDDVTLNFNSKDTYSYNKIESAVNSGSGVGSWIMGSTAEFTAIVDLTNKTIILTTVEEEEPEPEPQPQPTDYEPVVTIENDTYIVMTWEEPVEIGDGFSMTLSEEGGAERKLLPGSGVFVDEDGRLVVDLTAFELPNGNYTLTLAENSVMMESDGQPLYNREVEYTFVNSDGTLTGVELVTEDGLWTVYNLQGVKVLETTDRNVLKHLAPGLYIINNKATIIR